MSGHDGTFGTIRICHVWGGPMATAAWSFDSFKSVFDSPLNRNAENHF